MSVVSVFAFVFVLLAIGRVLRAFSIVAEGAPDTLNIIALYVCMPAAIILNAPQLAFDRSVLGLVLVPWTLLGMMAILVVVIARATAMDRASRACLLLGAPLGNTAFMGYALVPALAGTGALRYALVYDQFGSFLMLGTYGLVVVATQSGAARPTPFKILMRVVTFPPFIALVLGLTVIPAHLPVVVSKPLEMLSGALLPIVGLAVGMQLKLRLPRTHVAPLAFAVVAKLALLPLLALGLCSLFGIQGEMRAAAIFESAMPTMMTTGALLTTAGLAPELGVAIVGYTTIVSMVTLPLWRLVLTW